MGQVQEEISNAIRTLSLSSEDIQLTEEKMGKEIYIRCRERFLKSGDRRWWWEDFKHPTFSIDELEQPFEHLQEYIPDLEKKVWLMVEDDEEEIYPIYDCNPKIIAEVIGECFGFEYYIISKDLEWLLCENHHSKLIGTGNFEQNENQRQNRG